MTIKLHKDKLDNLTKIYDKIVKYKYEVNDIVCSMHDDKNRHSNKVFKSFNNLLSTLSDNYQIYKIVDTNETETNGTHLQGTIKTSYNNIVENFGKPELTRDNDKVDCEWSIKFRDGTIATIYNWKNGYNYSIHNNGYYKEIENITDWHIGGFTKKAFEKVSEILDK